MATTPRGRVARIIEAAKRYRRTVHFWRCRYDAEREAFVYDILLARARSGSRGGHLRARQNYELLNLCPEQREQFRRLGVEAGVAVR